MVYYYEQSQPMWHAILDFTRVTSGVSLVLFRFEFWFFVTIHVTCVFLFRAGIWGVGEFVRFRWEAVSATQLFMVFCLTFFNGHCFQRYLKLYHLCMDVLDGVFFFVQELVVSLPSPKVEQHRIRATKYLLALLHMFFIGLVGGLTEKGDWKQIIDRGLLTRMEAQQMMHYPSRSIERVLVLSTWTMQIVDKALEDDVFWTRRSMRIAHTHNRLQVHMNLILRSVHDIGDTLALPIPFPYYHVMNLVLCFNLLLLCIITASFKTYMTIFPYVVALIFFLGLREVSANIADPFNGDDCDFPVGTFLQFAVDNTICILEGFRTIDHDEVVEATLKRTREFTNRQLCHSLKTKVLYQKGYDATTYSPFSWNKEMPLSELVGSAEGAEQMFQKTPMVLTEDVRLSFRASHGRDEMEERYSRIQEELEQLSDDEGSANPCAILCRRCRKKKKPEEDFVMSEQESVIDEEAEQEERDLEVVESANIADAVKVSKLKERLEQKREALALRVRIAEELGHTEEEIFGNKEENTSQQVAYHHANYSFAEAQQLMQSANSFAKDERAGSGSFTIRP